MKKPKYNSYPTHPMSKPQKNTIFNLPQDIIFDILLRLPTKSLIHFRSVCTSSPPLISHPSFTSLHLSATGTADDHRILIYYESTDYINHFYSLRSPLTFQETLKLQVPYKTLHGYLRIVGSDKGLICLFDTNYYSSLGTVILWNPCIQKFKVVVDDPHNVHDKFSHFVLGFGFVLRSLEFKVVEIAYDLDNFKVNNSVLVYSLSRNSWEKKEGMSAPYYLNRGWSSNVFVNGFVNWLAFKEGDWGVSRVIMAFDLDDERFEVFDLPKDIVPNYDQVSISSYGEGCLSLSLCAHYAGINGETWDVWVMGDYGLVDSWKKAFVVSQPMLSVPPLLMKNDHEVLIVLNDGRLMLFDAIKNEMQDLETQGDESKVGLLKSFPYAEERLHLFEADICKPEEFEKAIQGCVFVFHVAYPIFHNTGSYKSNNVVEVTIRAVKKIAEACIRSGTVKRLIYTATVGAASPLKDDGSGYKNTMDESCWTPLHIDVPYAEGFFKDYTEAKTKSEQEILKIGEEKANELEVVTLGCGMVGGGGCLPYPSTSVLLLISQVANNATNYQSLRYSEELAGKIPIVHIEDVCRAHIFCAETLSITGRFLCASSYVTSAEIAKYYLKTFPQLNQEYLEDNGREIKWGSRKLEDKGFAYKHSTETILDDSLECVKRSGII